MLRHKPLPPGVAAPTGSTVTASPSAGPDSGPTLFQVPLTLLPYRLPERLYTQVRALVPELNLLYERVSRDREWLTNTLRDSVKDDAFISRLLKMLNDVAETPSANYATQTGQLSINRSDYMLQEDAPDPPLSPGVSFEANRFGKHARLLQVEFNTISVGAGSLCNKVADMHRFLLDRFFTDETIASGHEGEDNAAADHHASGVRFNLPPNPLISNLASGMARAHRLFLSQRSASIPKGATPLVLFVVQPRESNMSDQRHLEYALWREHRVPVRRMTLAEVASKTRRDEGTGMLWIEGDSAASASTVSSSASPLCSAPSRQLVSVVYFRAGYTPRDFHPGSSVEWSALESIERSVAIKAPSIAYHLAGTKKVQQVLATPGAVERFLPDDLAMAQRIRACFAGLWPVTPESLSAALANPSRFVLKPQREGGGNNLFHEQMVSMLQAHASNPEQLAQYILMEKIGGHSVQARPAGTAGSQAAQPDAASCLSNEVQAAPILKNGQLVVLKQSESELGMIGVMLTDIETRGGGEAAATASSLSGVAPAPLRILLNDFGGYLLRTKSALSNEGGLISGNGAIGSVVLVP